MTSDRYLALGLTFSVGLVFGDLLLSSRAFALPDTYAPQESLNRARVCIPVAAEATKLSVSASANTGLLQDSTAYSVICRGTTGGGVYWEMGDAAAATADSNSNFLPDDTLMYFGTGSGSISRYLSAVDISATGGTCYVTRCR
jgi:hypothetical protein